MALLSLISTTTSSGICIDVKKCAELKAPMRI